MSGNPKYLVSAKYLVSLETGEKVALPLSDEEIILRMDTAIYEVSSVLHENTPKLAEAIFAAIKAYEEAKGGVR